MKSFCLLLLLLPLCAWAQKAEYAVALIPPEMKEGANMVVRDENVRVNIASRTYMTINTYRAVTVLNKAGDEAVDTFESDDVRSVSATIYDASGKEIRKFKRKDFRDVAASDAAEITDDRIVYLDYTPVGYPYTLVYESEVATRNTAFIPNWMPVRKQFVSAQKTSVTYTFPPELGFKYKLINGPGALKTSATETTLTFTAENFPAVRAEQFAPGLEKIIPMALCGLEKFSIEGVPGEAASWENFSGWGYDSLLSGTDELAPATIAKIKSMTAGEPDLLKKAAIVYRYMQDKTRYVSIQLGIGGWRPMKAKDVDRLGYGDCKALTNYTRALLSAAGVPSYYAIIYGDRDKRDLQEDFVSMQGNHIILAIPDGDRYVWLECTNQSMPFGFLGDFTDDRLALLVRPEGGKLVRTTSYPDQSNLEATSGTYVIDASGALHAKLERASTGMVYEWKLPYVSVSPEQRQNRYKENYAYVNNLAFDRLDLVNDRDNARMVEQLDMHAPDYAKPAGSQMMLTVNAFDRFGMSPQRYRNRTMPFQIGRGYNESQEIVIELPEGFHIDASPSGQTVEDVFGRYATSYTQIDARHIRFRRSLLLHNGLYDASQYEKFRDFCEKISRGDNAKIVLSKS